MSSFHPDRDGLPSATYRNNHAHSRFGIAKEADRVHGHDGNDSDIETEDGWFDEPSTDALKNPSKISDAMAAEVCYIHLTLLVTIYLGMFQIPSWHGSVSATGSSASIPSTTQASNDATSYESTTSVPDTIHQANYQWPSDTEIVTFPGTNKIMLTIQSALMRSIFQDAFKHLRVSLLFIHAFPDPALTRSMITESLSVATQSHLPRSANIRNRLELDDEYIAKMCRLVSPSLITHFELALTNASSPVGGFPFFVGKSKSNVQG